MSNFFGMSVKPEIAALEAKVDIIDTEVDYIRSTDVANIQTNINANETKIDANANDLGHIRNTAIPNVITEIDANETKIDTIDGIVDAIKLKTDATPQNVRGKCLSARLITAESTFQEVVNVTGHGILNGLGIKCVNAGDTLEVRVTLDGKEFAALPFTGSATYQSVLVRYIPEVITYHLFSIDDTTNIFSQINLEFDTSLLVELRRSAGAAGNVDCCVFYSLDDF